MAGGTLLGRGVHFSKWISRAEKAKTSEEDGFHPVPDAIFMRLHKYLNYGARLGFLRRHASRMGDSSE